jgi:hypothetical protein
MLKLVEFGRETRTIHSNFRDEKVELEKAQES